MFNFNEINNKNPKKWNVKENQLNIERPATGDQVAGLY